MLLTATQASSKLGVSSCTLRRWHRQGKIAALRSPSGVRLYDVTNIMGSGQGQAAPSCSSAPSSSSSAISLGSSSRASPSPSPKSYIYARVSSGKSNSSSINAPNTSSSQTLGVESTSRGPDCVPYWNSHVADWSKK